MRRRWLVAAAIGIALVATALLLARKRYAGPVRVVEVVPGLLVAGQPKAAEWPAVVQRFGVRAVVNLRGARPGQDWYGTGMSPDYAFRLTFGSGGARP